MTMELELYKRLNYSQSIEKVFHKLYKNLGYSICIDPENKTDNVYFWIEDYCFVFKDLTINNYLVLTAFNECLEVLNPKSIKDFNNLFEYFQYLEEYYKTNGYTIELIRKPKKIKIE